MPKRTDISSILIIGAGPIVIGQACEFDYSGTQACKALKDEGYRVILINSNPATIMTDPAPAARLPPLGGQTALNTALALAKNGTLKELGIELIGAKEHAIELAEDRDLF